MSLLLLSALLAGCGDGEEDSLYEQFNSDNDVLEVEVGVDEELDARSIELFSTTGEISVGQATVTPGGVAAGGIIRLVVVVDDEYEHIVDRVSVRVSSGDRGEDEYDLQADSADEGLYVRELQAVADDGEQRTDTFTVRLWDLSGDDDGEGASTDTGP